MRSSKKQREQDKKQLWTKKFCNNLLVLEYSNKMEEWRYNLKSKNKINWKTFKKKVKICLEAF